MRGSCFISLITFMTVCGNDVSSTCEEFAEREPLRPLVDSLRYVNWSDSGVADGGSGRKIHLARGLLNTEEADAFIQAIRHIVPDKRRLDSIDGLPAYEQYVRNLGVDTHPVARHLHALEARMTPFLEATYNCSECYVCTVLLRRYRSSERMAVPSHYDRNAYLTAVASLNPTEFDGGLFLQRTPRADSREFFAVGELCLDPCMAT